MLEDIGELGLLAADVERDHDRSDARGGEERHHELAAVAEQECDPIALPYPFFQEACSDAGDALLERLPGQAFPGADERLAVPVALYCFGKNLVQAARPVRIAEHHAVAEMRLVADHVLGVTAPRSMTNTRSRRPCACARLDSERMALNPVCRRPAMTSARRRASTGATPSNGSSRSSRRVPAIMARASATSFCCPPERCSALRARNSCTSGMAR